MVISKPLRCNYANWLKKPIWNLQQAACILSGYEPGNAALASPNPIVMLEKLRAAVKNGDLKKKSFNKVTYVRGNDAIECVTLNSLKLPVQLVLQQKKMRIASEQRKLLPKQPRLGNLTLVKPSTITKKQTITILPKITEKPWLVYDPRDPEPLLDWFTPARYFARLHVNNDPTFLTNTNLLRVEIVKSLAAAKIFKRGKMKKKFDPATIRKALNHINLT